MLLQVNRTEFTDRGTVQKAEEETQYYINP
jgi:hypothetical protein